MDQYMSYPMWYRHKTEIMNLILDFRAYNKKSDTSKMPNNKGPKCLTAMTKNTIIIITLFGLVNSSPTSTFFQFPFREGDGKLYNLSCH